MYFYFDTVLGTINDLIELGVKTVDTKKIRRFNNIKSSDRCRINFIWRNLEYLKCRGYIELIEDTKPKQYRLPRTKIFYIKEVILG